MQLDGQPIDFPGQLRVGFELQLLFGEVMIGLGLLEGRLPVLADHDERGQEDRFQRHDLAARVSPGERRIALRLAVVKELSGAELDELIAEATVDCYGEEEQLTGLATMIADNLAVPFETTVLGLTVTVPTIDQADSGIVAICVRGKHRQAISVLDLPLPDPPPPGAEWIAAYRRWAR